MKNEESQNLITIVNNSGLEENEQKGVIERFNDYEDIAKTWEQKAKMIHVTNIDQVTEMKMAREARLFLREKRIAIERARKAMKEQSLRKGQAIDAIAKYLESLIEPIENYLKEQEDFVVIQRKKQEEKERIEAEKKELERIAEEERKQMVFRERQLEIAPYSEFEGSEKLTVDITKEGYRQLLSSLKEQKRLSGIEQEKVRAENERLRLEAEEKERQLKLQQEQAEKERLELRKRLEAQQEQARVEREKIEKQKQEIQNQLKVKEEAERLRVEEEKRKAKEVEAQKLDNQKKEIAAQKNEKYRNWLKQNNFDSSTMRVEREGNKFYLWQVVSEIDLT